MQIQDDTVYARAHQFVTASALGACAAMMVLAGPAWTRNQANALTITPSFDSSITAAPDAGEVESTINTVINSYERLLADPIDVTIFFERAPLLNDRASQSKASLYAVGYFVYTGQMIVDAVFNNNPVLATAVTNLASGNQSGQIVATSAGLRALGFDAPGLLGTDGERFDGTLDGVITLDSGTDFQFSRPVSPDSLDARWAIAHEIDEVLGVGGAGGSILDAAFDSGQASPPFFGGVIGGEDLYRYAAPGVPSLTLNPAATAFFSIDGGKTDLARFNQDPTMDYADWYAKDPCLPLVQRAAFCNGLAVDVTRDSPEVVALQAVGYELLSVPEPTTAAILIVGLSGVAALSTIARRCRKAEQPYVPRRRNATTIRNVTCEKHPCSAALGVRRRVAAPRDAEQVTMA